MFWGMAVGRFADNNMQQINEAEYIGPCSLEVPVNLCSRCRRFVGNLSRAVTQGLSLTSTPRALNSC